jgi:hypothetical protein
MKHLYAIGFIQRDNMRWSNMPGHFYLDGQIACNGNIVITVQKVLEILDEGTAHRDKLVQTVDYNYNASVRGYATFIRYDNAHVHPHHCGNEHVHRLDWQHEGRDLYGSPEYWPFRPTLGEFIEEVSAWFDEHQAELPEPDSVPVLDEVYVPRGSRD